MRSEPLRALHTFAGAGGAVIAFRALGIESVGAIEIDPFCCAVLEHHGEMILGNDVRTFDATGLVGRVDIVTGGWPCQGNSVAGKRRGLDDDRSNLWWQLLRILTESKAPYLFAENVRGALSVNHGRDFYTVLHSLDDAGYDARWIVTAAASVGAPHKRERLWLFAWRREVGDPARGGFRVIGREGEPRVSGHADRSDAGVLPVAHSDPGRCEQRDEGQRIIPEPDEGSGEPLAHSRVNADGRLGDSRAVLSESAAVEGGEGVPQQRAVVRCREGVVEHANGERRHELHLATVAAQPGLAVDERDVVNAGEPRLQSLNGSASGDEPGLHRAGCDVVDSLRHGGQGESVPTARESDEAGSPSGARGAPAAERGMGRADHGLAHGLGDWPAGRGLWPSGRGAAQHAWEAPRVVEKRAKGDLQALKALGNGWVPSQAIAAWLELTSG